MKNVFFTICLMGLISVASAFEISLPLNKIEAVSMQDGSFVKLSDFVTNRNLVIDGIKIKNDRIVLKPEAVNDLYLSSGLVKPVYGIIFSAMGGEMGGGK